MEKRAVDESFSATSLSSRQTWVQKTLGQKTIFDTIHWSNKECRDIPVNMFETILAFF